ncbi:hypothetical protein XENOCAPTIV_012718 [Xenoophorus captivus]|uniref:Uncharacterized protein n=1 Tax=Xenoophorus captivus TaxID=1517983 RepID=A0ABV0QWX6_9TELE
MKQQVILHSSAAEGKTSNTRHHEDKYANEKKTWQYSKKGQKTKNLREQWFFGVISKVTESAAWYSGTIVIPKPVKKPPRICVNLTPLNAAVKKVTSYLQWKKHWP